MNGCVLDVCEGFCPCCCTDTDKEYYPVIIDGGATECAVCPKGSVRDEPCNPNMYEACVCPSPNTYLSPTGCVPCGEFRFNNGRSKSSNINIACPYIWFDFQNKHSSLLAYIGDILNEEFKAFLKAFTFNVGSILTSSDPLDLSGERYERGDTECVLGVCPIGGGIIIDGFGRIVGLSDSVIESIKLGSDDPSSFYADFTLHVNELKISDLSVHLYISAFHNNWRDGSRISFPVPLLTSKMDANVRIHFKYSNDLSRTTFEVDRIFLLSLSLDPFGFGNWGYPLDEVKRFIGLNDLSQFINSNISSLVEGFLNGLVSSFTINIFTL
jgi:hypothetical protein